MSTLRPKLQAIALDTGGTMTDSFIVAEDGSFTVGKAQTTPDEEAEGIVRSIQDGLNYWEMLFQENTDTVKTLVYSGTPMLNRLLERKGNEKTGLITNYGFEDLLRLGRGCQCWIGLDYSGRLHAREHEHTEPLIPRKQIKGARGRINFTGEEIIPLYEKDVKKCTEELLDMGVTVIGVCFLCSYINPSHEMRTKEIILETLKARNESVPVVLSCEHNPVRGELPRLNTLLAELYAAEPSRQQLLSIRDSLQEQGVPVPLRILTSYGGTISPQHEQLVTTLVSGPIGGVIGSRYLSEKLGLENLVCSDVGGTSFDVALVTERYTPTRWESSLGGFLLNIPMIAMDSIGAGTGMYVRYNKLTHQLEFGPDSAGYLVGVCNTGAEVETVTMTDCSLVLGYLNPDYFLGGQISLDPEKALQAVEEQLARPMGQDPYVTARGALDLVEIQMQNYLKSAIEGLGFSPENYALVSYGGGGPLHVAGYTRELNFQKVLVPGWAAAFSAFGCACADYSYRHERTIDLLVNPDGSMNELVAAALTENWKALREAIAAEFERDGRDPDEMIFQPFVRVQYRGMLDDLEVAVASSEIKPEEVWDIARSYDQLFEKIFKRGTGSPHLGYHITKVAGAGIVPVTKPSLLNLQKSPGDPPGEAEKGKRKIYWEGSWHEAQLYEREYLLAGNIIKGPAVIEDPATTLLLPPGTRAELDQYGIFHYEKGI